MKTKFSTLFTSGFLALVFLASGAAHANFASDPTRKESASFTRFFLKRFDRWFSSNVGDPRKGLDEKEAAFIDEFLQTAANFGMKTEAGFVRTIRYGVLVEAEKLSVGPFRFLLSDTQLTMKAKILSIARAKGITLEKSDEAALVGIGFTKAKDELELVFKDDSGAFAPATLKKSISSRPVWLTRLYRSGKSMSNEYLEIDLDEHGPCSGSRKFEQVDRVTFENGDAVFSCHTTQFEDQALSPAARAIAVKIRRGVNLVPGVLEVSKARVRMFYP